jgi:hypothetical protein
MGALRLAGRVRHGAVSGLFRAPGLLLARWPPDRMRVAGSGALRVLKSDSAIEPPIKAAVAQSAWAIGIFQMSAGIIFAPL